MCTSCVFLGSKSAATGRPGSAFALARGAVGLVQHSPHPLQVGFVEPGVESGLEVHLDFLANHGFRVVE